MLSKSTIIEGGISDYKVKELYGNSFHKFGNAIDFFSRERQIALHCLLVLKVGGVVVFCKIITISDRKLNKLRNEAIYFQ